MTSRVKGLLLATVADEAPDDLGRIKVTYQDRPDEPISNWVHLIRPMASAEFGVWFQPEPGDQVVVGFLNGNLESPCMMGAIFTGSNAAPVTEPQQRVIRSKQGHEVIFDDTDGADAVIIQDANDNKIRLTSDGIEISTPGKVEIKGNEVVIKGEGSITIETPGQLTGKGQPIHLNP